MLLEDRPAAAGCPKAPPGPPQTDERPELAIVGDWFADRRRD
jgi:hypothetical protein